MICKLYKILFWLLPLKRWQAYVINSHFHKCDLCRRESGIDDNFSRFPVSPQNCQDLPSTWPQIKEQILLGTEKKGGKRGFNLLPKWQWALPVLALISIFLLLPYLSDKKATTPIPGDILSTKKNQKIIVKSVKMENQPAKTFFFKSNHPDRLIVWVQKKIRRNQ